MPNLCGNRLMIYGDEHTLKRFRKAVWESNKTFLSTFHPIPRHIAKDTDASYKWRIQNWSTRSDIGIKDIQDLSQEEAITLYFDTAWSPPFEGIKRISLLFPSLIFNLEAYEPGNGIHDGGCFVQGKLECEYELEIFQESDGDDVTDIYPASWATIPEERPQHLRMLDTKWISSKRFSKTSILAQKFISGIISGNELMISASLSKKEFDPNATLEFGNTPLMFAAYYGCNDLVKGLIRRGADPAKMSKYGLNALHWALAGGHIRAFSLLLREKGFKCELDKVFSDPLSIYLERLKPGNRRTAVEILKRFAPEYIMARFLSSSTETPVVSSGLSL